MKFCSIVLYNLTVFNLKGSQELIWPTKQLIHRPMSPFAAVSTTHLIVEVFLFVHPAILPLLMKEFGLDIVQAGLILSVPSMIQLISDIPSGVLADKVDPRNLLILGAVLGGLGAIIVSQSADLFSLTIGLCVIMMSVTIYHPPGLRIISMLFSQKKLTSMIGIHGAMGCIGQGLGVISMSLMIGSPGWRYCYLLWSIFLFVWSIILVRSPINMPQSEDQNTEFEEMKEYKLPGGWKQNVLQIITGKNFLLLIIAMSIVIFGNKIIFSFITTYLVQMRNLPEDLAALIFGIGPLIGVFGSIIGGQTGSRFGDKRFLSLAFFGLAISVSSVAYSPLIGYVLVSFLIYRGFFSSIWPASTSLVSHFSSESTRGMAYSILFFVSGTFSAVSPIIGALIIDAFGILGIFPFSLLFFLSGSATILLIKDKK